MLRLMFAIPNGGARNAATGAVLKREGVKAGVPDIFLPWPSCGRHGLFVEMKKPGGSVRGNQKAWQRELVEAGYEAVVCYGWDDAREVITRYLEESEYGLAA